MAVHLLATCGPTTHRFVWKAILPPPRHPLECLREPTAAARPGVGQSSRSLYGRRRGTRPLSYAASPPRPVSTTSRGYSPRRLLPTRYARPGAVAAPATRTRRGNVPRPSGDGSRPAGTARRAGRPRSRRPRRRRAGALPPGRGWACRVWTAPCSRQPPTQLARPPEVPAQRRPLGPAVAALHTAVERRRAPRGGHGAGAEARARPEQPRRGAGRRP